MATTPPAAEMTLETMTSMMQRGEKFNEIQRQQIENSEELRKKYIEMSEALKNTEDYTQRLIKQDNQRIEALKKLTEYYEKVVTHQQGLTAEVGREAVYKADLYKQETELQRLLLEKQQLLRKEEELERKIAEAGDDKAAADEAILERERNKKALEDKDKAIAKQKVQTQELEAYYDAGEAGFDSILKGLGIQDEKTKLSFTQSMLLGKVSTESFQRRAEAFFESGVALQRTFLSFAEKVFEMSLLMAKQLDVLRAEAFKASGGMTEFGDQVMFASETAGFAGVSFESMSKSFLALNKNSSNFTELTNSQRASVAANNAQLAQLGISADVAAKNFSLFTQSLGMTTEQANASSRELVSLANNLHMSFEEIASGFGEASRTVAAYGQNAVAEFSKLAAESKALGISVQELINIVKGADTFQGAAEQAGKLNAMLGGGLLNSSQLLVASESERIELIRDAVMQTGRSFSTMSKYEQIALANAAGIQDLTVAQKLFNQQMDGDELDRYLGKTNALGMSQEEMQKQAAAAQETQEKLKIIMEQFAAAMSPVVSGLAAIVNLFMALAPVIKAAATLYMGLIIIKYGVAAAQFALTVAINAGRLAYAAGFTATMKYVGGLALAGAAAVLSGIRAAGAAVYNFLFASSLGAVDASSKRALITFILLAAAFLLIFTVLHKSGSPMLYAIFGFMAIGMFLFGEALNKNKQGILAFGAAMMMVGVGAFLAFHGLEGFANALSKLNTTQLFILVAVIGLLTVAMLLMFAMVLYVGAAAVGPLLALGAAFLMMGAGAYLAALGFSILADSFIKLAQNMETLIMLPLFLQLMAVSLIAVSVGLAIFAYTLINVGLAMMVAYIPILAVIGAITALSLALNSISPEKSFALKTTTEAISQFVTTGKNVTPEALANLEQVVKQIHDLNIEANISKAVNVVAPFKEIVDAINGQTQAQNEGQQTVVMKLDDKVFGSAVIKTMNSYGTANTSIRKPTPAGSGM
ncbi:MAG: hypothetical protein RIR47_1017 [Bacteroidota bacterium]|jgi:hypothetical protein